MRDDAGALHLPSVPDRVDLGALTATPAPLGISLVYGERVFGSGDSAELSSVFERDFCLGREIKKGHKNSGRKMLLYVLNDCLLGYSNGELTVFKDVCLVCLVNNHGNQQRCGSDQ